MQSNSTTLQLLGLFVSIRGR